MTATLAGHQVEVDHEGYMQKPEQWNKEIAQELANEVGIGTLNDRHWRVIEFMRAKFMENGTAPSIRALGKESGVPVKELYQLFPKGPAKLAARVAGIPKPRGCV